MHEKRVWRVRVPNIKDLNLCLLGAWVRRYIQDGKKMWKEIVDRKYCRKGHIL
jgi:hypothetical protein